MSPIGGNDNVEVMNLEQEIAKVFKNVCCEYGLDPESDEVLVDTAVQLALMEIEAESSDQILLQTPTAKCYRCDAIIMRRYSPGPAYKTACVTRNEAFLEC